MPIRDNGTKLTIPWESTEGLLKGMSAIDMRHLAIHTVEEADEFIMNYGFDVNHPEDAEEIKAIFDEALSYVERCLLDPSIPWLPVGERLCKEGIPKDLTQGRDVQMLLVESSTGTGINQLWACALLKVMHIISHMNHAVLVQYFEEAQSQILSRYQKVLTRDEAGRLWLGQPGKMQLAIQDFEVKDEKSRDSLITKLLCKRENVAEAVFDMIGVRIITDTPADAVIALEVLRRNKIVLFPNIISSRTRNSLVPITPFKEAYEAQLDAYMREEASLEETLQALEHITPSPETDGFHLHNQASSEQYRAIHITQRQLIRIKSPGQATETRFFFPYEIQLVDCASHHENVSGHGAHHMYKQNQLMQARRRVLGPLLAFLDKSPTAFCPFPTQTAPSPEVATR